MAEERCYDISTDVILGERIGIPAFVTGVRLHETALFPQEVKHEPVAQGVPHVAQPVIEAQHVVVSEPTPAPRRRPGRSRTLRATPILSVVDFPVGCAVLTPRHDDASGVFFSYCTVIAHHDGQLRVAVPGESPQLVSLSVLQRTGEKYGLPLHESVQPSLPQPHLLPAQPRH